MRSGDGARNGSPSAVSGAAVLQLSPLPGAPGGVGTGLPLLRAWGVRAGRTWRGRGRLGLLPVPCPQARAPSRAVAWVSLTPGLVTLAGPEDWVLISLHNVILGFFKVFGVVVTRFVETRGNGFCGGGLVTSCR